MDSFSTGNLVQSKAVHTSQVFQKQLFKLSSPFVATANRAKVGNWWLIYITTQIRTMVLKMANLSYESIVLTTISASLPLAVIAVETSCRATPLKDYSLTRCPEDLDTPVPLAWVAKALVQPRKSQPKWSRNTVFLNKEFWIMFSWVPVTRVETLSPKASYKLNK